NIGARATVIFDNPYDVAGSTHHDEEEERIASRTGRLREGEYTACAVVADLTGFSLAESCTQFTIVYPDPPLLLSPANRDVVTETDPLFQWTPVQVPVDFQLSYVMRVVEVLNGQTPQEALRANIPHYQSLDGQFPSLRYPIDARPFEVGKQYAWTVQVLDQNGYAASANDGRSEIWTFSYDDGSPQLPTPSSGQKVILSVYNTKDDADKFDQIWGDTITSGLWKICSTWDTGKLDRIIFPVISQFAFSDSMAVQALLVRDTTDDGQRSWALGGAMETHTVMLAGQCAGNKTVPHWVGVRTRGDSQEVGDWLDTELDASVPDSVTVTDSDTAGAVLEFGVAIFSLFGEEVGGSDSPEVVQAFLEGHEIELKTGLNLYGVIDLRQFPNLWSRVFSHFLDDDEHELELQGFAGFNQTMAVRLGARGQFASEWPGVGADVSHTREWLNLRGTLPAKKFDNAAIKSIQYGVELTYGDSIAYGLGGNLRAGASRSYDLVLKPTLEVVTSDDVTWTGTIEMDAGMSWSGKNPFSGENKLTLRVKTDHEFQPGLLDGSACAIGHPEVALDINDGLIKATMSAAPARLDWDFNLRGSFLFQSDEIATLGLTVGRSADKPIEYYESEVARKQKQLDQAVHELRRRRQMETEQMARNPRGVATHNAIRAGIEEQRVLVESLQQSVRKDSTIVADYKANYKAANRTNASSATRGKGFWQASLALGNMGILDLINLLTKIPESRR
ncbi:MAG TPA: hypothetical protein VGD49_04370, partial [Longimicrobiales bacterium]